MSTRPMVLSLVLVLLGCAPVDEDRPAAQRSTARLTPRFDDPSSPAGTATDDDTVPCDDGGACNAMTATNPTRHDDPNRCAVPLMDCPCSAVTPPVACDVDTNGPVTPRTCYLGQRDCAEGHWGRCRAYRPRFQ